MFTFEGIYTPAITPYAADGRIDFAAFADVLESLTEAQVHGIIIGGQPVSIMHKAWKSVWRWWNMRAK
ncbi:hypothetical protein O3W44_24050 [Pantoea sp. LMR881]|uniref:hypothetical protein n=1 Tax=Pantoea sp. LMR881 TaxID=3014336 RepID=UPI0022AFB046|nr:hypothetical protein [Pantoea sp. LMR881]MCZ4061554.1 hypothetical protein [Pantoea sp. LMR881]